VRSDNGKIEVQSVGRDVTVEREIEEKLRDARNQAEAANRKKSRFLAAMSHEIRTPMNGILGIISLMRDTRLDAEQQTYARVVEDSARALLVLLDGILDFSKIEAGKLDLASEVFSLRDCIAQTMQLMGPDATAKRLSFTSTISDAVPEWVRGDEMRLRQIVLNLLSNAIKFTDAGGVAVRTELAPDKATNPKTVRIAIEVSDSGIGFSPDAARRLFDEFEQGDTATSRHPGSAGLGLAISKRLAQAMSGEIVARGGPQKGAVFTALLELQFAEAPAKAAVEPASLPDGAPRYVYRRQFSVLVAEDNHINALLACKVIERAGGKATVVEDGRSAIAAMWETLERKRPAFDLVLMDVLMPEIDGLTATKSIKALYGERKDLGLSCPPIIALTANAFAEDRERCRAAGMDDYLAKPFDARDLHNLLLRWTIPQVDAASPAA
jgi:CheY-like chemotaxis protein/nitrogen-specific signal transduction histidine kinase